MCNNKMDSILAKYQIEHDKLALSLILNESPTIYTLENLSKALKLHKVGPYALMITKNNGAFAVVSITFGFSINPWVLRRRKKCKAYIEKHKMISLQVTYD